MMTLPARKAFDGVAVLARAAGSGLDVLDAVVDHDAAVVADDGCVKISMPLSEVSEIVVLRDQKSERVERHDGGGRDLAKGVAADFAGDVFQPDAVAAAVMISQSVDANVAAGEAVNEAAPVGQRQIAAVERQIGEADVICARACE